VFGESGSISGWGRDLFLFYNFEATPRLKSCIYFGYEEVTLRGSLCRGWEAKTHCHLLPAKRSRICGV